MLLRNILGRVVLKIRRLYRLVVVRRLYLRLIVRLGRTLRV